MLSRLDHPGSPFVAVFLLGRFRTPAAGLSWLVVEGQTCNCKVSARASNPDPYITLLSWPLRSEPIVALSARPTRTLRAVSLYVVRSLWTGKCLGPWDLTCCFW